jgi:hypothetical protein
MQLGRKEDALVSKVVESERLQLVLALAQV